MLTKTNIMAGLQCPKRLWLLVHRPDLAPPSDSLAMRQGYEVGKMARRLFPGGRLIEGRSLSEAKSLTAAAIQNGASHIFEATVSAGDVLIKADVLSRESTGWSLTEVKRSEERRVGKEWK